MATQMQTLKGFRDFLPREMAIRNRVKRILIDVFESFGFEPLSTPDLEYTDVLLGKYGEEADKLVYTFEDRGGRMVGMPYDLTVPTARVAAQHGQQLPTPFKRYQIQRVHRAENTQKGRYREFEQCDIDILDSASPLADAEVLAVIARGLERLTIPRFRIYLNSRPLLFRIMTLAGVPQDQLQGCAVSLDKLDKLPHEEVKKELMNVRNVSSEIVDKIFDMTNALTEQYPTSLEFIESSEYKISGLTDELSSLQEIARNAIRLGVEPLTLIPSFTLARGLDYYTGSIFETVVTEPNMGSITGGGRYDNLISQLGGPQWPAVGTTFGLDRICDIIEELGIWSDIPVTPTQVMITIFSEELSVDSLKLAKLLRDSGVNAEVFLDNTAKLDKQIKYADKKNIPWLVIMGPEEVKNQTLILKNLKTGTQETMQLIDLAHKLR